MYSIIGKSIDWLFLYPLFVSVSKDSFDILMACLKILLGLDFASINKAVIFIWVDTNTNSHTMTTIIDIIITLAINSIHLTPTTI